ncbi:hypothetical protein IC575_005641 [Cucumis melo]
MTSCSPLQQLSELTPSVGFLKLATAVNGVPLFEIFLRVNKMDKYKQLWFS